MITRAVILSTGDELTTGRVVDTNSSAIAAELSAMTVETVAVLKVGDDREHLLWALRQAHDLGDVIIGTGGLGPTTDDLTTEVVAQFLGRPLHQDAATADSLKQRIKARGLVWTENTLKQAYFPEGATILPNPLGTAPGNRSKRLAGSLRTAAGMHEEPPPGETRWEYKLVSMGNPLEPDVELRANALGKLGWELAAIEAGVWIFKRRLADEPSEPEPLKAIIEQTVPIVSEVAETRELER